MWENIVPWSIPVRLENYFYGTLILIGIIRNRKRKEYAPNRFNHILYALLYYTFGTLVPYLFKSDNIPYDLENRLFMYLYLCYLALDIFWWFGNYIPNIIRVKKNPELLKERDYSEFVKYITDRNKDNLRRDLSRKALHLVMWSIVIFLYVWARANANMIENDWGFVNYFSFVKFCYTLISYSFCFMFTLGDWGRLNKYHWLPAWARKWYRASTVPREAYTYVSSIPYILTLSLFQFAPIQVLFISTSVSCFADAAASIIGKAFGKHKFPPKRDPKKSFEGLWAGSFAGFLSSAAVLYFFPIGKGGVLPILTVGVTTMIITAAIDYYIKKIADNITYVLLPGIASWLWILYFSGF